MDRAQLIGQAGVSAGLAAALCLAISNIVFVAVGFEIGEAVVWSAWLAGITLGLAWAGTFFGVWFGRRSADVVESRVEARAGVQQG